MAALSFFTGFPGFIGKRLVARLLADDSELRVAALVEPRMVDRARTAAARSRAATGSRFSRATSPSAASGLLRRGPGAAAQAEVTVAYHLAAIYNLAVPLSWPSA